MRNLFLAGRPISKRIVLFGLFILIMLPHLASARMPAQEPAATHWEQTLNSIPTPELHVFNEAKEEGSFQSDAFSNAGFRGLNYSEDFQSDYYDVPREFRKYQNSHIAPIRIYSGCGAVAVGGVMMYAGYVQDTKYPWSGPYMSPSPLNVFGILIVAVGVGLIVSGLIFYSKFRKHTIMPYNKAY